jgi:hypothetical protein
MERKVERKAKKRKKPRERGSKEERRTYYPPKRRERYNSEDSAFYTEHYENLNAACAFGMRRPCLQVVAQSV